MFSSCDSKIPLESASKLACLSFVCQPPRSSQHLVLPFYRAPPNGRLAFARWRPRLQAKQSEPKKWPRHRWNQPRREAMLDQSGRAGRGLCSIVSRPIPRRASEEACRNLRIFRARCRPPFICWGEVIIRIRWVRARTGGTVTVQREHRQKPRLRPLHCNY